MTLSLLLLVLAPCVLSQNMNGDYLIANPNTLAQNPYSTVYTDEYFDVYSPMIETQYSEVFWTMMGPVPLPQAIVERFDGKVLAITGYEVNQVRVTPEGDVPVPITHAYNHHYEAYLEGKYSSLTEMKNVMPSRFSGHDTMWMPMSVESDPNPDSPIPTGQWFSEGNGGEFRKSYHGYPRSYVQLIDSPTAFSVQPMQIDTHNRDYNGTGFVPGPLPRNSAAPPNATYSGLLECPCTTRIQKTVVKKYTTLTSGLCGTAVQNATECYTAAVLAGITGVTRNTTGSDTSLPTGCVVVPNDAAPGVTVLFNTAPTSAIHCGSSGKAPHVAGSATDLVVLSLDLNANTSVATITMSGPDGVWFGVGFNASYMSDVPYTIVVNGTGGVQEVKLANHAPGFFIQDSITVVSSTVVNGTRTVVMTRALTGLTPYHYTFDPTVTNIPFIDAIGDTPDFEYHKEKSGSIIYLVSKNAATCVCNAGEQGYINGLPFNKNCAPEPTGDLLQEKNPTCWIETYQGGLQCCHHQWFLLDADQEIPAGVDQYQLKFRFYFQEYNATYHQSLVRLYFTTEAFAGEYDIVKCPAGTPPEMCVYTITARFKVSDMLYNCSTRNNPSCTGYNTAGVNLIYAGGHCHAPSCLSMELYNADTGDLICQQLPVYGNGTEIFNELGFLALPPCIWGSEEEGLMAPPYLTADTNLLSIKRNNNTFAHYGEMASWQMRGVSVPL